MSGRLLGYNRSPPMASREATVRISVQGVPQVVAALNRAAAELDRMATGVQPEGS